MLNLQECIQIIEKRISRMDLPKEPKELYQPIEYILSIGGKRLRPALVLLGANLFSDQIDPAIPAALTVEIFHNFTLLHDDIMDHAELRRGKPTVHQKWDENIAILSGDAMSIYAYVFLSEIPEERLTPILKLFNTTALQICEGQQMDMNFEALEEVPIEAYLKMIELKTAVLMAAGLKMGALAVAAPPEEAGKLYEFGKNLGIAFQLQDDLLDSYGDPAVFGKKIGGDILAGKKTYLILAAFRDGGEGIKKEILEIFRSPNMSDRDQIEGVKSILDRCGVRESTESAIREYYAASMQSLSNVRVEKDRACILEDFANNLMSREQ